MIDLIPPGLILLAGALLIAVFKGHARTAVIFLVPVLTMWMVWQVPDGYEYSLPSSG